MLRRTLCLLALGLLVSGSPARAEEKEGGWVRLFNGKDLTGWTPKITGYKLGVNFKNTFRVEDGVLKVSYDGYGPFTGQFGHLFYKDKFSHYILRVEYRFVGDQVKGGPNWAFRNSGIMFHCQDPASMDKDQSFPVSVEAQMLGGNGKDERPTANVCTPGTHIVIDGKLVKRHCNPAKAKTYHGNQWVTMEIEVRGDGIVKHRVNGETVLEYEKPQLDPTDAGAKKLLAAGASKLIKEGYISLQAESHPCEFRKVEIRVLKE